MKKIKKTLALLLAAAMLFTFAACGGNSENSTEESSDYVRETKTKVAALSDALGFGLAKLAKDRDYAYEVKNYSDAEEIVSLLKEGEADIASLPVDTAAKLYKETKGGIKILSVNTLGMLYCIENGSTIKSFDELKGKTIKAVGKDTVYEFVINHVLTQKGLVPGKDITVEYGSTAEELAAISAEGKADFVIVPEPYATNILFKNENAHKLINFAKTWSEINENLLVQGVIVARTDFISENPDIITEFMGFNEVSVNYISANPESSAVFFADNGYYETSEIAYASLPQSNVTYIEGEEMKTAVKALLGMIYASDPTSIPDDGIYYVY